MGGKGSWRGIVGRLLGTAALCLVAIAAAPALADDPPPPFRTPHNLSLRYAGPGKADRETRDIFQDSDTDLLYVTDGNGGATLPGAR
jgi:hypothetical protein